MKFKISILVAVIFSGICLASGRYYELYYRESSPDGKYSVEIFEIMRYYEFNVERGYHDALIYVKDKNGNTLKKMWYSPSTMCDVSWERNGVLVGGVSFDFE